MFLVAHYSGTDLAITKIFSSLEIIFSLKFAIYMFNNALDFYYQIKVTFERFVNIFNIKRIAMAHIDFETKEPIKK
jgi:hypothetical protein